VDLKQMLRTEFTQRHGRNARYSLRAFARDLGTDHATLSQILRDRRGLSSRMIHRFGERLDLPCALLTEACVQQDAEAILRMASKPAFRTHSRWIAARTGISVDAVNIALQRLLHRGDLAMRATDHWYINPTIHA
jgi:transcriptional regulator with XRE-family HTH domain